MRLEIAQWLLSNVGRDRTRDAMEMLADRTGTLAVLTRLRKTILPEQATAAWELADLRQRGRVKFGPEAAQMWFVREALEQASGAQTSAYHAQRFVQSNIKSVADVCGGIGGDALAFARAGLSVTLHENDEVRALFAQQNALVLDLSHRITVIFADAVAVPIKTEAIWFDPARRSLQKRVGDPEDYSPPLSTLRQWAGKAVGVKLSPAADSSLAAPYEAELEFISEKGECKEALLWTGTLRQGIPLRAQLISERQALSFIPEPDVWVHAAPLDQGQVLYEPDPAVIRAGGVPTLARHLDAQRAAPQIAYLIGKEYKITEFAKAYAIVSRFTYSLRRLQKALHERSVGRVTIKKRGFPIEPDALRSQLKLRGTESLVVVLAPAPDGAGHQVILCQFLTET